MEQEYTRMSAKPSWPCPRPMCGARAYEACRTNCNAKTKRLPQMHIVRWEARPKEQTAVDDNEDWKSLTISRAPQRMEAYIAAIARELEAERMGATEHSITTAGERAVDAYRNGVLEVELYEQSQQDGPLMPSRVWFRLETYLRHQQVEAPKLYKGKDAQDEATREALRLAKLDYDVVVLRMQEGREPVGVLQLWGHDQGPHLLSEGDRVSYLSDDGRVYGNVQPFHPGNEILVGPDTEYPVSAEVLWFVSTDDGDVVPVGQRSLTRHGPWGYPIGPAHGDS